MRTRKISGLFFPLIIILLCVNTFCAQQDLIKARLVEKANELYESGQQKKALDLIGEYPEFGDEVEVLYIKSVAYSELRDYKNADIAFQKQFDNFRKSAAESLKLAEDLIKENPFTLENRKLAALMYSSALVSFASADLANSLRSVAFEKNGMSEAKRQPKNLIGFAEFRKNYEETAINAGSIYLQINELNDALKNFEKAIELNSGSAAAYRGRAQVYRKMKKIKLAVADETAAKRYGLKK